MLCPIFGNCTVHTFSLVMICSGQRYSDVKVRCSVDLNNEMA